MTSRSARQRSKGYALARSKSSRSHVACTRPASNTFDLFNMVKTMGPHAVAGGGSGGGVSIGGGRAGADSQRLHDLLKEQQQFQAAAQPQQYQTLAQQFAEIASAKGEDWRQVLTGMGDDITAFEKGLGMTDAQTQDHISAIQKQKDGNDQNTQSIVAVLNQILSALGGTPAALNWSPCFLNCGKHVFCFAHYRCAGRGACRAAYEVAGYGPCGDVSRQGTRRRRYGAKPVALSQRLRGSGLGVR